MHITLLVLPTSTNRFGDQKKKNFTSDQDIKLREKQ